MNPFNGEGIPYAMESGELAAQSVVQALARPDAAGAEQALMAYPQALRPPTGATTLSGAGSFRRSATRR